jgi:hypothetical protein
MKAICTHGSKSADQVGWTTAGREYLILGVVGDGANIKFRILADDRVTPILEAAQDMELTDPAIPAGWLFQILPKGGWKVEPLPFSRVGFWEDFFDRDPAAIEVFRSVLEALGATD